MDQGVNGVISQVSACERQSNNLLHRARRPTPSLSDDLAVIWQATKSLTIVGELLLRKEQIRQVFHVVDKLNTCNIDLNSQ